uniref:flagellar protein FlgN n=1 Tax=Roseburia sp. TaxID=2049040 RepID=UPI003FED5B87
MASLMEDLLDVLEKEEAQYETLIALGDEKREAVIKADIAKLDDVTIREQDAASVLLNLSNRRTQVLNDMATVLGKNPGELTITKMIGYLDKQPVEQEKLTKQRDRLLDAGARMRALNQQNEALLKQALEMVEFDLTLLRSMRQAPETANYDRNAYNTGDILGGSGFDAKQ